MRHDQAGLRHQHAEARGRRVDRLDVGDHAVHRHVARHHRLDAAVGNHGRGEGHHQLAAAGIDIGRRHHRLARGGGLAIPRAAGRIVARRNAGRVGEHRPLVVIADIDVGEAAGVRDLLQRGGRVGLQHRIAQRRNHSAMAVDPVGNRAGMARLQRGQRIVDRRVVVGVGDHIVDGGIDRERGHDDSHAQRHDARADGGEHTKQFQEMAPVQGGANGPSGTLAAAPARLTARSGGYSPSA